MYYVKIINKKDGITVTISMITRSYKSSDDEGIPVNKIPPTITMPQLPVPQVVISRRHTSEKNR